MTGPEGEPAARGGWIVPIGGAEERDSDPRILKRFVELCRGEAARIAIIPTASASTDTGAHYVEVFEGLGVGEARSLPFDQRADCSNDEWLAFLDHADGVFLTGGNQLRLSTTLGGTRVAKILRDRNQRGLHVAGTSAGAAFLSEHMIAFGDEGSTPRADMVTLAPGLGLSQRVIIDQHFRQRDRLGRLVTALAYNPEAIGIGLDEDTAAFIRPDDVIEVHGTGAITIVDPEDVEFSSMDSSHRHDPVCVIGIRMHVLIEGGSFDLNTRRAKAAAMCTGG